MYHFFNDLLEIEMSKLDELLKQQEELQKQINAIREQEKEKILDQIRNQIVTYDIKKSELFFEPQYVATSSRVRKTKEEREGERIEKNNDAAKKAREMFQNGLKIFKIVDSDKNSNDVIKYWWDGKKGAKPKNFHLAEEIETIEQIV